MRNGVRLVLALALAITVIDPSVATARESGRAGDDAEIIGGQPADPGEYPFQVALLQHGIEDRWSAQFCGGTLISPDTVLTAGHCVVGARAADIDILAGTHSLLPGGGGERVRARKLRLHPGYDDFTLANDIAIVQLDVSLAFPTIDTIQPGQEALWTPGTTATTIGWGDRDIRPDHEIYPRQLREVEVPLVSDQDCEAAYPGELIASNHLCAGDTVDGGEDSCYGDSGGPLMVPNGEDWAQVGIVSTGRGCALRRFPGIYTEVARYARFINRFLDPDSEPDPVRSVRQRPVAYRTGRVSWTPPFFDGGTRITRYLITIPDLGRNRTVLAPQTRIQLRDLPPGEHLVTVRAENAIGTSDGRSVTVRVSV